MNHCKLTVKQNNGYHCDPEKGARPRRRVHHGQHDGHDEDDHHGDDTPDDARGQVSAGNSLKTFFSG